MSARVGFRWVKISSEKNPPQKHPIVVGGGVLKVRIEVFKR